jgi:hypothetical protein
MPRKTKKEATCRHCGNTLYSRDVCQKHAAEGRNLIKLGLYTDDELVANGFWAKAKPSGRPCQNSEVFEKLLKAKAGKALVAKK